MTTITAVGDVLLRDRVTCQNILLTQVILMENNSKNIISLVVCNDVGCVTLTADDVCTVSLKDKVVLRGVLNAHARLFLVDAFVHIDETFENVQN